MVNNAKIKICGLSRPYDIESANMAMPDYIGFIFYPKSHRYVTCDAAKRLKSMLDPKIKTVGVFVNVPAADAFKAAEHIGLDVIQLHGDETGEYIRRLKRFCPKDVEVWKAVRIREGFNPETLTEYADADRLVLDTYVEGYGGGGKSFNLDLIKGVESERIILAGGLGADNVCSAIETVHPYGVDMSSSVETNKLKDRKKIIDTVNMIRKHNKAV